MFFTPKNGTDCLTLASGVMGPTEDCGLQKASIPTL
jgi:hypothetical protein